MGLAGVLGDSGTECATPWTAAVVGQPCVAAQGGWAAAEGEPFQSMLCCCRMKGCRPLHLGLQSLGLASSPLAACD